MSAARPVIVAIDGVTRKLIAGARAGIYVEPENAEEFADAVLKLKKEWQLRHKHGENGLSFLKQNFARDTLADNYMHIITNKVVGKKL